MSEAVNEKDANGETGSLQSNTEPEYVLVASPNSDEPIELPTNVDDNTLGMTTLTHAFPGAHGLKFKNPKTGASRALLIDATGTKFCAPAGGWTDKLFTVIYQTEPTKRLMPGEQNPKRKKMMDDAISSDDESGDGILHGTQVTKLLRLNKEEDEVGENGSNSKKNQACTDLLILGLPYKLEEKELKAYFEKFGTVELAEIKKNSNGEGRGFGFIRMSTLAEQHAVLDATHNIGGRKCHVKFPISKTVDPQEKRNFEDVRLFVGHLDDKVTSKRLREFFGAEARKIDPKSLITDAFIPTPFRHFGFINLSSPTVAKELLKKDTFEIDGKSVTVSIAAPKQQPPPPQHYEMYGVPPVKTYHGGRQFYRHFDPNSYQQNNGWEPESRFYNTDRHYPDHYVDPYDNTRYDTSSPYPSNSQSISTGLETMNLNNMKPDVMGEALKAFWNAARSNNQPEHHGGPTYHPPSHHARPSAYPRRGHPASSPSSSRWR